MLAGRDQVTARAAEQGGNTGRVPTVMAGVPSPRCGLAPGARWKAVAAAQPRRDRETSGLTATGFAAMAVQASRSSPSRRLSLSQMFKASSRSSATSAVGTWPKRPSMTMRIARMKHIFPRLPRTRRWITPSRRWMSWTRSRQSSSQRETGAEGSVRWRVVWGCRRRRTNHGHFGRVPVWLRRTGRP